MPVPAVPESCTQCPHLDVFHNACTHPLRQLIINDLDTDTKECPMFTQERAAAMNNLERDLDQ